MRYLTGSELEYFRFSLIAKFLNSTKVVYWEKLKEI